MEPKILNKNISFSKMKKTKKFKYFTIFNIKKPITIKISKIKYIDFVYNNLEKIYILKFNLLDSNIINTLENINNIVVSFISNKKSQIFSHKIDKDNIKNLFFSNIVNTPVGFELNIQTQDIKIVEKIEKNKYYELNLEITGIWIYQDMFGTSYKLLNILAL